jgi:hypothetical protein
MAIGHQKRFFSNMLLQNRQFAGWQFARHPLRNTGNLFDMSGQSKG